MQLISRVLGVVLALAFLSGCFLGLGTLVGTLDTLGTLGSLGGVPVTPVKLDKQPGGIAGPDLIEFPQNQSCRYVGGIRRCD